MIDYEFKFFCNMHQKQPLFIILMADLETFLRYHNICKKRKIFCVTSELFELFYYAVKFILEHIGKVSRNSYLMIDLKISERILISYVKIFFPLLSFKKFSFLLFWVMMYFFNTF